MSRENVDVVRGLFESVNARDFASALDVYADDAVLALHGEFRLLGGEGAVGKAGIGEWFADWFATFASDYRFEIEETRDWGDRVFLVATHYGRGRTSGTPMTEGMAYVYTMQHGKIVRQDVWPTAEQALAAASPPEPA